MSATFWAKRSASETLGGVALPAGTVAEIHHKVANRHLPSVAHKVALQPEKPEARAKGRSKMAVEVFVIANKLE